MEIGSHDRLQEGVLSLELANGVNHYPNDDEASMETEQQRAGSVPSRQRWVPGHGKVSDTQQQQSCWSSSSGTTSSEPVHRADMEDAHNLVAFSVIAGSLPPSSSSSCLLSQPNTAQLYEKFTQETGAGGVHARLTAGVPEGSCQAPPEDLDTLQTALSQAKHGHKPPNCNCDGPDCPDYLEWLEKKIKLATSEDRDALKMADAPPHIQPHLQQPHLQYNSQTYQQMNGGHLLSTPCSQQKEPTQGPQSVKVTCSKPPIPCSPQVLSIAKEKNISLKTAIAIDALTQLCGTNPQVDSSLGQHPYKSNIHHHQHSHNITSQPPNDTGLFPSSPGTHSSSSRSQSVPPGLHTSQQAPASCEHHRPQSQGHLPHASPLPPSTSPYPGQGKPPGFSPNPQQWQQGAGRGSEQRNPWMCTKSEPQSHFATAPHSSSDPMSELKQLLGDTSGKFSNAHFKLPVAHQLSLNQNGGIQAQDNPALARIKQESDSGEHYHHTASMGHYGMANGQAQGQHYSGTPLSPGQAAISHSTQAALQQHLHYKRTLFSNHSSGFGAPGLRAPLACQTLKKWWPQIEAEGLPHPGIKQEPKKKKSSQGSPVIKAMSGLLVAPPLPKPKQIIIKKTKQKASMPTFLPQSQISIQKPPVLMMDRPPALMSLQAGSLSSLPLLSNSTQAAAAAGLPAPAQSQVPIFNSSMTPSSTVSVISANTPALMDPPPSPVALEAHVKSEGAGSLGNNTSTTTPVTSTSPSTTSELQRVINIDPKYEELIRQFEAEFGDSNPETSASQPVEETATVPKPGNQAPICPQDLSPTSLSTSQSVPLNPTIQASATPHSDDQQMEFNKDESGTQSEVTLSEAPTESHAEKQHECQFDVSLNKDITLEKQQQQQQPVLDNTFSMPCSPLPKRMKIEASGDIAVLSTTCYSEEDTPTKDSLPASPSLKGFLESPLRYLNSPIKSVVDTPSKDLQAEFPTCTCVGKSVHHCLLVLGCMQVC